MLAELSSARLDDSERLGIYGASRIALCQEPRGQPGRDYLLRERGLDWETIAKFRFGYVPSDYSHAFSGKIVMPIFDMYDRLLALSVRPIYKIVTGTDGSRTKAYGLRRTNEGWEFRDDGGRERKILFSQVMEIDDEKPKYWNEIFAKGEHLFGLNLAKQSISRWGFAILVEGQMDVASFHARGLTNAVGIMGGAFTPFTALKLRRWTTQVALMMDGDVAGQKHTALAVDILAAFALNEKKLKEAAKRFGFDHAVVPLPKDSDPDSYIRKHGARVTRKLIVGEMARTGMSVPEEWRAA